MALISGGHTALAQTPLTATAGPARPASAETPPSEPLTPLAAAPATPDWTTEEWQAVARAAITLRVFDALKQGCMRRGGFKLQAALSVDDWLTHNKVDQLRPLLAELERTANLREQAENGAQSIVARVHDKNPNGDCEATLTLIRLPQSETLPVLSALQARQNKGPKDGSKASKVAPATAASAAPAAAPGTKPRIVAPVANANATANKPRAGGLSSEVLKQIERFGFDARPTIGTGGFFTTDIYPVVLFKDGSALTHVADLTEAANLAELRQLHPEHWAQWRPNEDRVELQHNQGPWQRLAFRATFPKLPEGFMLDGHFSRLSGTGNLALGGTGSVATWQSLQFRADGTVLREGGAGGTAQATGTSVATRSRTSTQRGRYRIEGLLLKLQFDDGSSAQHLLITDPQDVDSAIWLDGIGYARDKR